jgi:hypothetical protein
MEIVTMKAIRDGAKAPWEGYDSFISIHLCNRCIFKRKRYTHTHTHRAQYYICLKYLLKVI